MALSAIAFVSILGIGLTYSPHAGRAEVAEVAIASTSDTAIIEPTPVDTVVTTEALAFADAPLPEPTAERAPHSPAPDVNPCADALSWVAAAGLPLPAGVDYLCPSTMFAHHGTACWQNGTYCPRGGFIAINMEMMAGTSTAYLRHVVAHEVCHIIDFQTTGRSTEPSADACAAAYGAP